MANNNFKQAALIVLEKAKKPLHYKDITKVALEDGILETVGATPESTMASQLNVDIKKKGTSSSFIRISPGVFSLSGKSDVSITVQDVDADDEQTEDKVAIESGYTGKAGEHLVTSELLFRGFNASIMSVDVGMDIIATKDSKLFSIQVKTSNVNRYDLYVFDVRKVSFERHNSGNIFYVFVLHGVDKDDFLIVPFLEMEKKVHEKAILEVGHGKRYRVNIKFRNGSVYLGNMNNEMDYYLNNWSLIK